MADKKTAGLAPVAASRDPFAILRQMTSELDRMWESPWPALRFPSLRVAGFDGDAARWTPGIDVCEKDGRLVTKVDLPGVKKEDVKVEVTDGHLAISGERKSEAEEKQDQYYRVERQYGSFYRSVPLPDGVKLDDVKATFADGVLEVSVPLPPKTAGTVRTIAVEDGRT